MTDLTEWIKERRRIHNAATEGTWAIDGPAQAGPDDSLVVYPKNDAGAIAYVQPAWDDADAIVDAHNVAVPVLLTAVENVLEAIAQIDREYSKAPVRNAYADGMCDAAYMFDKALSEAIEGAIK